MIRILKATALAILVAGGPFPAVAAGLDAFGWKNRVLIVFANPGNSDAAEQRRLLLEDRPALSERDMVIIDVSGDAVKPIFGAAGTATAAELRKDTGIQEDTRFAAILIGKDGGEKLRSTKPFPTALLERTIDAMPMRRAGRR